MTENNDAINLINQAKDQARKESIVNFFCKNKTVILNVTVVAIVALVGFSIFSYVQSSREEKFSEILHQSLIDQQIGDVAKAKENLKKIYDTKSAPSGVWSLASLRYAAFLLSEGNLSEAEAVYQEINNCKTCDRYIRELGGLLLVANWMSDENELAKPDLSERIEKIENSSKVLRYNIAEQRGFLELHRDHLAQSYNIFESIAKNPEAQKEVKARAEEGMKIILSKGFDPKAEVKKDEVESESQAK
jgi:hypothetical protein